MIYLLGMWAKCEMWCGCFFTLCIQESFAVEAAVLLVAPPRWFDHYHARRRRSPLRCSPSLDWSPAQHLPASVRIWQRGQCGWRVKGEMYFILYVLMINSRSIIFWTVVWWGRAGKSPLKAQTVQNVWPATDCDPLSICLLTCLRESPWSLRGSEFHVSLLGKMHLSASAQQWC